jgi:hypothetical protein
MDTLIQKIQRCECREPSNIYWFKQLIEKYKNEPSFHPAYQSIYSSYTEFKNSLIFALQNTNFFIIEEQFENLWLRKNGAIFKDVVCFANYNEILTQLT